MRELHALLAPESPQVRGRAALVINGLSQVAALICEMPRRHYAVSDTVFALTSLEVV